MKRRGKVCKSGAIRAGGWADVVIFDLASIQDLATYEAPTEAPRGIDYVLVNGQIVMDHGRHTGARPGHVLYGPGRDMVQSAAP